jgi:hypothetical protein
MQKKELMQNSSEFTNIGLLRKVLPMRLEYVFREQGLEADPELIQALVKEVEDTYPHPTKTEVETSIRKAASPMLRDMVSRGAVMDIVREVLKDLHFDFLIKDPEDV